MTQQTCAAYASRHLVFMPLDGKISEFVHLPSSRSTQCGKLPRLDNPARSVSAGKDQAGRQPWHSSMRPGFQPVFRRSRECAKDKDTPPYQVTLRLRHLVRRYFRDCRPILRCTHHRHLCTQQISSLTLTPGMPTVQKIAIFCVESRWHCSNPHHAEKKTRQNSPVIQGSISRP